MAESLLFPQKEKPLSPFRRTLLIAAAAGLILLAYVLGVGWILLLLILILFEILMAGAAARFGGAALFIRWATSHWQVLMVFLRSGWIDSGESEAIPLAEVDAPGLYRSTRMLCDAAGIEFPDEIHLALNLNASVRLPGFRKGKGRSVLTIGLDLLAALNASQVEAVLAHEIMHARHVQRGATHWLRGGMVRIQQLSLKMGELVEEARRRGKSAPVADYFRRHAQELARRCTRLVAACSRQDEFDADRGAAELCGTQACESALIKSEMLGRLSAQIPLHERIAQSQTGRGVGHWLEREFAQSHEKKTVIENDSATNPYSTHPALADRLAAMPIVPARQPANFKPGLSLLSNPDSVANRLFAALSELALRLEKRESRSHSRNARRLYGKVRVQPLQLLGIAFVIVGLLVMAWGLSVRPNTVITRGTKVIVGFILGISGVFIYRRASYRADFEIPIPDYKAIQAARNRTPITSEEEKRVSSEIEAMAPSGMSRKKRVSILAALSHTAMAQCDYPKAFLASRASIRIDKKSVAAATTWLMSCAVLGHPQNVPQTLRFLQYRTGLPSGPLAWAGAWSFFCLSDWYNAEFLLKRCLETRPDHHTLHALLAIALGNRGKWHTAVAHAREACRIRPKERELTLLLANILLKTGDILEATAQLSLLEVDEADFERHRLQLEICLLTGSDREAEQIQSRLEELLPGPPGLIALGIRYESYRKYEKADELFRRAVANEFFPAALLGLARGYERKGDFAMARSHALQATNLLRSVGQGGATATALFLQSLQQLLSLAKPIDRCQLWWATILISPHAAIQRGTRFIVLHRTVEEAATALSELWAAMLPGLPPLTPAAVEWRHAPRRDQPDMPMIPGVHSVRVVK